MDYNDKDAFILGIFAALGVAIVFLFLVAIASSIIASKQGTATIDRFTTLCAQQDGHIYKPDTIYFCLTKDERFIEIYP